jgi:hypothetical protein
MEIVIWVVVALAGLSLVRFAVSQKKNPRIRMLEWNKTESYVRLYPNPGFQLRGRHWCKAKGRGRH